MSEDGDGSVVSDDIDQKNQSQVGSTSGSVNPDPEDGGDGLTEIVETVDENKQRFVKELEFVQALSNPAYLKFLSDQGLFEDLAFIGYLKYLLYWKQPAYSQFLMHPQCLAMLHLLQHKTFRDSIKEPNFYNMLCDQVFWQWKFLNVPSQPLPEEHLGYALPQQ